MGRRPSELSDELLQNRKHHKSDSDRRKVRLHRFQQMERISHALLVRRYLSEPTLLRREIAFLRHKLLQSRLHCRQTCAGRKLRVSPEFRLERGQPFV